MVVVSHLFLFLRINFGGRRDSCESRLPPIKAIYFPTAPFAVQTTDKSGFVGETADGDNVRKP